MLSHQIKNNHAFVEVALHQEKMTLRGRSDIRTFSVRTRFNTFMICSRSLMWIRRSTSEHNNTPPKQRAIKSEFTAWRTYPQEMRTRNGGLVYLNASRGWVTDFDGWDGDILSEGGARWLVARDGGRQVQRLEDAACVYRSCQNRVTRLSFFNAI